MPVTSLDVDLRKWEAAIDLRIWKKDILGTDNCDIEIGHGFED